MNINDYTTVRDIATSTGLTIQRIHQIIAEKKLPTINIGKTKLIATKDAALLVMEYVLKTNKKKLNETNEANEANEATL